MADCAIPSCTSAMRAEVTGLSMHRFPVSKRKEAQRNRWTQILRDLNGDPNWNPTANTAICSRHFKAGCFPARSKIPFCNADPTLHIDVPLAISPTSDSNEPPMLDETVSDSESQETAMNIAMEDDRSNFVAESEEDVSMEQAGVWSNNDGCLLDKDQVTCPNCRHCFTVSMEEVFPHVNQTNVTLNANEQPEKTVRVLDEEFVVGKRPRIALASRKRLFETPINPDSNQTNNDAPGSPELVPLFRSGQNSVVVTPRSRVKLRQEHNYSDSPTRAARELKLVKQELETLKKAHKSLKAKYDRHEKVQKSLKEKLSKSKFLTKDQINSLENEFPEFLKCLVQSERKAVSVKGPTGRSYDEEIKKFAATLHFYSPRAYSFVREYLSLPHPNTISSWMRSSDCGPGYNLEVLNKLSEVRQVDATNTMTDVVMTIDEMAIHKDLVWDQSKHQYVGHIDFGNDLDQSEDAPLASNVLVCMIAAVSGGWKVPVGYIFTDKTDGITQKTFLDQGFGLLEERGFNVHSITTDGNAANVSTFEAYGIIEPKQVSEAISYEDVNHKFINPANPTKYVQVIYDIVHMMKLWRNLIGQCEQITLEDGSTVDWRYIKQVLHIQENESIRAANKLGRCHVEFDKHKMSVKFAVQALSKSVADTIVFCREDLKLPEFQGSEGTSRFLYLLDRVFDILNSRNPAQKGYKAPLNRKNYYLDVHVLKDFCNTILKMKYTETRKYKTGKCTKVVKYLTQSSRKRSALGMVISIKSIIEISENLLFREIQPFRYVMTYRFSQDLVELFFNKVRGRLGRNNNPNVLEFRNIMKKIWHQNLLKSSNTGNCVAQMELKRPYKNYFY